MIHPIRMYPRLRRPLAVLLLAFAVVASAAAQQARITIIALAERKAGVESQHLMSATHVVPLTVDMNAFRSVATNDHLLMADVPLSRGLKVDLDLQQYSIFEPDAQLTVTTDHGLEPLPATTARLYRGTVAGSPNSWAFLSISDNDVMGSITVNEKTYQISTDLSAPRRADQLAAQAYPLADVVYHEQACGVNDHNEAGLGGAHLDVEMERFARTPHPRSTQADEILYSVKGAFEADYEYLNDRFAGDKKAAGDYAVQIIGQMSAIYERDLGCQITISYLNLWDTRTDHPYTETASMETALYQANAYWNQSKPTVKRAFTHILSGKPWINPIGIAFLDVLCPPGNSTAFSLITRSNPEQDMKVLCHETGHNFGSKHTHSCSWNPEVDRCAPAEDGACFSASQVTQTLGTIMSYCSQSELKFHDKGIPFLKDILLKRSCVELSRRLTVRPLQIYIPNAEVNKAVDTTFEAFFQNNSRQDVTIDSIILAGTNVGSFTLVEPTLADLPFTLKAGQYRTFKLHFLSTTEDPSQVTMTIKHNALHTPVVVNLEAYAREKAPILGIIGGGNKELDFKVHRVGETVDSTMKNVFANIGTALLRATKTEIVGPDRFEFQMLEGNAPFEIESGAARRSAKFRFAPTSPGDKVAYLRIESNGKGKGIDTLTLRGKAKVGPRLTMKVANLSVNFGQRLPKHLYDTMFAEFFYNSGGDSMQVIADLEGENKDAFTVNVNIIDLPPGESYALPISLYDSTNGYKKAYLVISQVELTGNTIYRRDTVWLLAQIGTAAVPGTGANVAGFTVAPNPANATAEITIAPSDAEIGKEYTVVITDAAGREVRRFGNRFTSEATTIKLNTTDLAAGRYFLQLTTASGQRNQTLTIVR